MIVLATGDNSSWPFKTTRFSRIIFQQRTGKASRLMAIHRAKEKYKPIQNWLDILLLHIFPLSLFSCKSIIMDSFRTLHYEYITAGSFPVSTVPVPAKKLKIFFFLFYLDQKRECFISSKIVVGPLMNICDGLLSSQGD